MNKLLKFKAVEVLRNNHKLAQLYVQRQYRCVRLGTLIVLRDLKLIFLVISCRKFRIYYTSCLFSDQFNITSCSSCSNACSELEYEPRVSYSKFPDVSIATIFQHYFHRTESLKYMQENYVFLQVGFQRLSYEMREDVPSYGAESLFGELGGNMGLLLGCSVLTICEFFDFLWESIKSRIRRRNEQNSVSSSDF
ncbi:acid-sensing ion channel 2-like [Porites lutea]|uniref:acid-sensing ion channel 2-like n=1 Tax=Porites lutea TaxID=51062 RepID=UPI003CC653DD